jgi:hypothetical protein
MKPATAVFVVNASLMDTLPVAIASDGRCDRSRRKAITRLLRQQVTALDDEQSRRQPVLSQRRA